MELKVKGVGHTDQKVVQANGDIIERDIYSLSAIGKDGFPKVTIKQITPFKGMSVNSVIDIDLKNSQKSIDDFEEKGEE